MPKAKKALRQDVVGSSSQRGKQGEEPVTDTVMQVIARRIRNAKKKMQKVTTIEALLKDGSTLNEDQERVYQSKSPLNAIIEELQKLEPLVEAALHNEQEKMKEDIMRQKDEGTSLPTDVAQLASEEGESETTVEGPARDKPESDEIKSETPVEDEPQSSAISDAKFDSVIEALYFVQLFTKDRFDVSSFIYDESEGSEANSGFISAEEAKALETFGRKIFHLVPQLPKEALESAKKTARTLISESNPDAIRVLEIVDKLKGSEFMTTTLKLTVRGFPIAVEREVSDSATDNTDKSEGSKEEETQDTPTANPDPGPSNDNPPPSTPVYPVYVGEMPPKSPRPFLPFPGVAMTAPPSMGYSMPYPSTPVPIHSYYTMGPMPSHGHFLQPHYTPPMETPPASDRQPVPEEGYPEAVETHEEPKEESTSAQDPSSKPEDIPVVPDASDDTPVPHIEEDPASVQPEIPTEVPAESSSNVVVRPRGTAPPHSRSSNPASQGRSGGRGPPWQGRGGRSSMRGGFARGRGRGRYPQQYNGPPRRPPSDPNQPSPYRAPFMQPSGGERHPYEHRSRQRGGYSRENN